MRNSTTALRTSALLALAAVAGCASAPAHERQRITGALVQVELEPPTVDEGAREVEPEWRALWTGMSRDATTLALLSRLYGGLASSLEELPAGGPYDLPPSPGKALTLRVRDEVPPVVLAREPGRVLARRDRVELVLVGPAGLEVGCAPPAARGATPVDALAGGLSVHTHALRIVVAEFLARRLDVPLAPGTTPIDQQVAEHLERFTWTVRQGD